MDDITRLAERCKTALPLSVANLGAEYGYKCLPLCVIDAVWSIGVRYGSVRNVVSRYEAHFHLEDTAAQSHHTITDMVSAMQASGLPYFTDHIFQNRQRTSTRNGILKTEAVFQFASTLLRHNMNTIDDVPKIEWFENLGNEMSHPYAEEILSIPGQTSGIALTYFYMLTGSPGLVKADRMVIDFLQETLNKSVSLYDAQRFISYASQKLCADFPEMTPRMLDHQIWKYQRQVP
ncbi:MAG: hypothetical protein NT023_19525 [Armatimonadetes bacterium]|nr:hypothetical protein [Armatimonadota bacterium]